MFGKNCQVLKKLPPLGSPLITQKLGHPKVTSDQPSKPWKFCSNPLTCSKVIHDFHYHGWTVTNSIQNESPLYPIHVRAACFFYLSQNSLRLCHFVWIKDDKLQLINSPNNSCNDKILDRSSCDLGSGYPSESKILKLRTNCCYLFFRDIFLLFHSFYI